MGGRLITTCGEEEEAALQHDYLLCRYALIVLRADDNGQGGTFALYSLLKRQAELGKEGKVCSSLLHNPLFPHSTQNTDTRHKIMPKSGMQALQCT